MRIRLLFVATFALAACGPQTYEDCVIDVAKHTGTVAALNAARASCRAKFPEKETPYIPGTIPSCAQLKGSMMRAGEAGDKRAVQILQAQYLQQACPSS